MSTVVAVFSAVRRKVLWLAPLLASILVAEGCGLFDKSDDSGSAAVPDHETMVPYAQIYPAMHLGRSVATFNDDIELLYSYDDPWVDAVVGPRLSMLVGVLVYPFYAISSEPDQNGAIAVLPDGWGGGELEGFLFYTEDESLVPQAPAIVSDDPHVFQSARYAAAEEWNLNTTEATNMKALYLGSSDEALLVWAIEAYDTNPSTRDPDHVYRCSPVIIDDHGATVEANFYCAEGFSDDFVHATDLNGDRIADLVILPIFDNSSRTRAFLRDTAGNWQWVASFGGE